MEPKSSEDAHGMNAKTIKLLKYELAVPLLHLFNLSINSGSFPENLKTSRIVPRFKGGITFPQTITDLSLY